jgi:hypothetical protein
MKCPEGLTWIPDREYCSKCPPGQIYNAEWGECQGMDRSVINPAGYHTATASLFMGDALTDLRDRHKSEVTMANYIAFALVGLGIMAVILHHPR